jgi:hypothetical protein
LGRPSVVLPEVQRAGLGFLVVLVVGLVVLVVDLVVDLVIRLGAVVRLGHHRLSVADGFVSPRPPRPVAAMSG